MSNTNAIELYRWWIEVWNGKNIDLENIFHTDVVVRQAPHERHGIEAVRNMIEQGRAPFDPIEFQIEVDPILDENRLAARWQCNGAHAGDMPEATIEPGTLIRFGGIDIWRLNEGKVSEYWVSSDGLWLMQQLAPDADG